MAGKARLFPNTGTLTQQHRGDLGNQAQRVEKRAPDCSGALIWIERNPTAAAWPRDGDGQLSPLCDGLLGALLTAQGRSSRR